MDRKSYRMTGQSLTRRRSDGVPADVLTAVETTQLGLALVIISTRFFAFELRTRLVSKGIVVWRRAAVRVPRLAAPGQGLQESDGREM